MGVGPCHGSQRCKERGLGLDCNEARADREVSPCHDDLLDAHLQKSSELQSGPVAANAVSLQEQSSKAQEQQSSENEVKVVPAGTVRAVSSTAPPPPEGALAEMNADSGADSARSVGSPATPKKARAVNALRNGLTSGAVSRIVDKMEADGESTSVVSPKGATGKEELAQPEQLEKATQPEQEEPTPTTGAGRAPRAKKKAQDASQPRQRPRAKTKAKAATPVPAASCPASRQEADLQREMKEIKRQEIIKKTKEKAANVKPLSPMPMDLGGGMAGLPQYNTVYDSPMSAGERECKKGLFVSFYKEQYARIGDLDVSQYDDENASLGLKIKDGHRHMPRPKQTIDLPPDYKKPIGTITPKELRKYGCTNPRMLLCVHGDLFDVSDRPDKYSDSGPYWAMVGHDITWGLVCGNDDSITYDQYFDIFKICPVDLAERKMQGLMSWWCFYEKEYGEPVGRLSLYNEEWKLPAPPEVGEACVVM